MIKLLNAGFTRLRKNKLFWLLLIFSIGFALFIICNQYSYMKKYEEVIEVGQLMLTYSTTIGIVIAIFTSLFLGVEYSDGAIRNKISIGHKRMNIYLSNLILVTLTSLFSYILFLIVVAIIGIPLFGAITVELSKLLMSLVCIFLTIIAYSSIFTFMAMLISNKTITAIATIMLAFCMMFGALMAFDRLAQPEYIDTLINKDGIQEIINTKNRRYLVGKKRDIYQLIIDVIPAGQMFQLAGGTEPNLKVLPLYSLGIIVVFTSIGLVLFKKKELK
jgi:hypothetical protein